MKIPLFLLSQNEGIPFVECTTYILVDSERVSNYWLDIKNISSIFPNFSDSRYVIFGYVHPGHDPDALYSEFDLEKISEFVHGVGILAKVSFEDGPQGQRLIRAQGISYALIHSLHTQQNSISELITDSVKSLTVEWKPLTFSRKEITKEVVRSIDNILNCCTSSDSFPPEGKLKIARTLTPEKKLEVAAFFSLPKEETYTDMIVSERLAYVQAPTIEERVAIVVANISPQSVKRAHNKNNIDKKVNDSFSYEDVARRINSLELPKDSIVPLTRELNKLQRLKPDTQDFATTLDYLNLVAALPWKKPTPASIDIKKLLDELDSSHFGLEGIKREVAEHLAIQQHTGDQSGTILCFNGPPGTGKTSIAQAIAKATGRKLIRLALGGVSDEAVFRGFRRTYFNSKPGRIISSLRDAGTNNVLILLDEIDKLGAGRSDPSSALLEILDPEQNNCFVDQYLEIPYDLSCCMFICTSNNVDLIQPALKDRLDLLEFSPYDYDQRLKILKDFILPKALKEYKVDGLTIEDDLLAKMAENPQIRQVEKQLKKLLRSMFLDKQIGTATQLSFGFLSVPERKAVKGFS